MDLKSAGKTCGARCIIPACLGRGSATSREENEMSDSTTRSDESRTALIFAFVALAGSIIMGLLSNFLR